MQIKKALPAWNLLIRHVVLFILKFIFFTLIPIPHEIFMTRLASGHTGA